MSTSATTTTLRHLHRGTGPAVLLIAGLGDPAESWQFQLDGLADRYTAIAFDNRGAGTSPLPVDGRLTTASMADDAAQLLGELGLDRVHVAGFSGGGMIAQELALRHPGLVRSLVLSGTYAAPDALARRQVEGWRWLSEHAPSERAFLEMFLTYIYSSAFHASGAVDEIIDAMLVDPNPQTPAAFRAQLDAFAAHDTRARLARIDVPTLVVSGRDDLIIPPRHGHELAARIPGARHVLLDDAAHQPFQEDPHGWNRLVDEFWQSV